MKRIMLIAMVVGCCFSIGACGNTWKGIGQDIEKAGAAIVKSSDKDGKSVK